MDPAEIEFLAENELVEIVPKFNYKKIMLIGGEIGPFRASIPLLVPIWLATNLKTRQKCSIKAPGWMDVDQLEEKKKEETGTANFCKVPSEYYIVEAQILIRVAAGDIPKSDALRTVIKDIWDKRLAKLRSSVDRFIKEGDVHSKLDNLTSMEINAVRPFLPYALDLLNRLRGQESSRSGSTTLSALNDSTSSASRSILTSHLSSQP